MSIIDPGSGALFDRVGGPGFRELLAAWARDQGLTSLSAHRSRWEPGQGYTGAVLIALEVAPPARLLLLKVLPADSPIDEPAAHRTVFAAAPPEFQERHLVELAFAPHRLADGRTLMFQKVASGILHDTVSLSALSGDEFTAAVRAIVRGLLTGWNGPALEIRRGTGPTRTTAAAFLRQELADARARGSVDRSRAELGIFDGSEPWVFSDGENRPNPYLMVAGDPRLPDPELSVLSGLTHRDLHLDNALVPRREGVVRPDEFHLIDLSGATTEGALSCDVATLLLSALVPHVRAGLPPDQSYALLRFVIDPHVADRAHLTPAVVEQITAIRGTARDIMHAREWDDPWQVQFLLSVLAEGLRFATYTDIGPEGRTWFALLAAHAGGHILRRAGVDAALPLPDAGTRDSFQVPLPSGPSQVRSARTAQATAHRSWELSTGVDEKTAVLGFGPDDTLVVVDGRGGVRRWTVDGTPLPPPVHIEGALRVGHQALVASLTHSVAVALSGRLHIVHFIDGGAVQRVEPVALGRDEFLVTSGGDIVATHDRQHLRVRRFRDGQPIDVVPCPPGLATAAVSTDGSVVALARSREVHIHRRGEPPRVKPTRNSVPHLRASLLRWILPDPGCWLAVSPSGSHVACATFEEVVVWRLADDAEVLRRPLTDRESRDGLGATGMRLLCDDTGTLLWLKRGRLTCPTDGLQLEQAGYYNDVALSRDGRLIAGLYSDGRLVVREWKA